MKTQRERGFTQVCEAWEKKEKEKKKCEWIMVERIKDLYTIVYRIHIHKTTHAHEKKTKKKKKKRGA